jgi:hypothetical protein
MFDYLVTGGILPVNPAAFFTLTWTRVWFQARAANNLITVALELLRKQLASGTLVQV